MHVVAAVFGIIVGAPPAPSFDLPPSLLERRSAVIRERFGYGPQQPLGPGPKVVPTPRFLWVEDQARTLPAPPWTTDEAYAEAFELARGAWAAFEEDRIRLLVVFSTFAEGGRALFYTALANDVRGLGMGDEAAVFDASPGSALEGYAWMGALSELDAAGPDVATEAFLHEIGHRWGAYAHISVPGLAPELLLGRNGAHWSFLVDTDNSPLEGNDWRRREDGRWTTDFEDPRRFDFSPLDLYLMGVLSPDEVPPFTVLLSLDRVEPSWFSARPEEAPAHRLGVTVSGMAYDTIMLGIEDVIAAAGPRIPMAAEGLPVHLPIGVVLLSDGHSAPEPPRLAEFDRRVQGWLGAFASATGGRMVLDAELRSAGRVPLGGACQGPEDCDRRVSDRCAAPQAQADLTCTRACTTHDGCGAGFCCVGTWAPGLCVAQDACGTPPAARDNGGDDTTPPRTKDDATSPLPPSPSRCACATTGGASAPRDAWWGAAAALLMVATRRRRRR